MRLAAVPGAVAQTSGLASMNTDANTDPANRPQMEAQRRFLLGSLILGHSAIHWYQQLFPLLLPSIKASLGLNDLQVGGLSTAREALNGVLMMPSGFFADSFVRYRPLIMAFALATSGLAYSLVGLAPSYLWALPAVSLVGLASAAWHPAAVSSLSASFPERRGMALALHGVGASVGDTVAPLSVGALLLVVGWERLMQYHLLPAFILAFILWRSLNSMYKEQEPGPSFRTYMGGIKDMVRQRSVLAIMIASGFMGMGRLSVLTFMPIYLTEDLGHSSFWLGFYLALLHVMGMVSQPVMGIVSDKFGRKWVLLPAFTTLGLLYLALPLAGSSLQLSLVVAAMGLFFYGTGNIATAAVMDVSASQVQGSTMSVMSVFRQIFTLPSPIIAGVLVTEFGTEAAFFYAAAILLAGAAVLAAVRTPQLPPTQEPDGQTG